MTRRFTGLCVALALALAGCGALGYRLEAPRLTVVKVEFLRGDLLQQTLRVRLHVQNPNRRELPVSGITYEIYLADEKLAQGESERDFIVPALGETEFDVSVTANAAGTLLKLATGGLHGDTLDYRLVGRVTLKSGLLRSLPFEHKGHVDLRQGAKGT